jgi:hypothetical protein
VGGTRAVPDVNRHESFDSVTPALSADTRQTTCKFCDLMQSSAFWKNAKALRDVLESLHLFLREWDSLTERLPDVFTMDDAVRPPLIPVYIHG